MNRSHRRLALIAATSLLFCGCALNGFKINSLRMSFSIPALSPLIGQKIFLIDSYGPDWISGLSVESTIQTENLLSRMTFNEPLGDYSEDWNAVGYTMVVRIGDANRLSEAGQTTVNLSLPSRGSDIHNLIAVTEVPISHDGEEFTARFTVDYSFGAWY